MASDLGDDLRGGTHHIKIVVDTVRGNAKLLLNGSVRSLISGISGSLYISPDKALTLGGRADGTRLLEFDAHYFAVRTGTGRDLAYTRPALAYPAASAANITGSTATPLTASGIVSAINADPTQISQQADSASAAATLTAGVTLTEGTTDVLTDEIQAQANAVIDASNTNQTSTAELLSTLQDGVDDLPIAVASAASGKVEATKAGKPYVWTIDPRGQSSKSKDTITVMQGYDGPLGFAYGGALNPNAAIGDPTSVTIDGTTIVLTNLRKSADGTQAMFDAAVPVDHAKGTFIVRIVVDTTDSVTLPLTGTIEIE